MAAITPLIRGPHPVLEKRLALFFAGYKKPQLLDTIIPNVSLNLFSSSQRFIEGLYNNERDFIASVSSPYLLSLINKQLAHLQSQSIRITRTVDENDKGNMAISPYVVFGQSIKDRLHQDSLMKSCRSYPLIGWNRYFRSYSSKESISQYLKSFSEKQVYGFDCYFQESASNYKFYKNDEQLPLQQPKVTHVISFETDSVDQEFWVVDYNFVCLQNDRLT